MSLYFAYGSNMDQDQMHERCSSAELLGPATLTGYRLAFTIFSPKRLCGCADIVPSHGDTVYGLLYRLSDVDMQTMDGFEGHPVHYRRIQVKVNGPEGEIDAYSYEVVSKQDDIPPSEHYLGLLQAAADRFAFPESYQVFLQGIKINDKRES
jgi:gamma-glutamylcyclotransferase (GGCT)/AIG2-like uncharacterized protein YtfP